MAARLAAALLAVCAAARGITEPLSAITPGPVSAEDCPLTASMPGCGLPCLISAANAVGCNDILDLECQCSSQTLIRDSASSCVLASCGEQVGTTVESVASAICSQCA
ncbi:uncharacterized protein THITE_2124787 [Thermothielavioides terrestris NRRL 8126]|uniref:CFEM domain-containing protein n=1 Tax=Thermothielavioides terrestris (strain ATCC 38088 / NRRL 8126) TaxID=578455 RepID=G2RGL7_THETT|nr:uncharacterized protein THITE_2124787 [Thermothielavioides terrestris NRRL 8126]AEO71906.1 hypothetical protein THITE_2124787 [Thermothielavioides terrestris NRRL 8126]